MFRHKHQFSQSSSPEIMGNKMPIPLLLYLFALRDVMKGETCWQERPIHSFILVFSTGNAMLLRVLPCLYEKQSQPINSHLKDLVSLMSQLEQPEQQHLLRLLLIVAKKKQPEVTLIHSYFSTLV